MATRFEVQQFSCIFFKSNGMSTINYHLVEDPIVNMVVGGIASCDAVYTAVAKALTLSASLKQRRDEHLAI